MTLIQNRGAFLRRLTAGGSFTESQAEVLADALEGELGQPATKGDLNEVRGEIAELRAETKGEIAKLRAELKGDIAELRAETKGEIGALRAEMRAEIKGLGATLSERMDRIADRTLIRVTVAMAGLFGLAIAVLRLTGPMP